MKTEWQPIYSVERSGVTEITIAGAVSVVAGRSSASELPQPLLTIGDVGFPLWTRSLLKPWQLLSHLPELKKFYPQLTREHYALMMASHNAEPMHMKVLHQIMSIGECKEEWLRCPPAYPSHRESREHVKEEGKPESRLYHNCSGKHFGYLMAIKAEGGDVNDYINPAAPHFVPLKKVLGSLLHKDNLDPPVTTDGCQLPNYGVSIQDMATLYQGLANVEKFPSTGDRDVDEMLELYPEIRSIFCQYPLIVSGHDRLDCKIMTGGFNLSGSPTLIAKEGAEGLLAIGIGKTDEYPNGLGIVIKLSSGFDTKHMETIATEILAQLGLGKHGSLTPPLPAGTRTDHVRIKYHFKLNSAQPA
jgi:L-asparaginase II